MVRILATLMRPDAGTATIAGHDLLADPVGVKRSISLTGQYAAVDEKLTGRENLEMMAQLLRLSRRAARVRAREMHLVDEGVTVLLTTQYLEEADQLADTVAVLDHGRVVAQGTPDELKARLGAEVVRLQFADVAGYERALGGLAPVRTDDRLHTIDVATEGTASEIFQILDRLQAAGGPRAQSVHLPPQPGRRVPDRHPGA